MSARCCMFTKTFCCRRYAMTRITRLPNRR
jgi:hypothetical protein